jgi:hypothetical protein
MGETEQKFEPAHTAGFKQTEEKFLSFSILKLTVEKVVC